MHRAICDLYSELIRLRKRWPCLHNGRKDLTRVEFDETARWLRMERSDPSGCRALLFCNFSNADISSGFDAGGFERALCTVLGNPDRVPA